MRASLSPSVSANLLILTCPLNILTCILFCHPFDPSRVRVHVQAINRIIVKSAFLPLFFGTSILSLVAIIVGALRKDEDDAKWAIAGGTTYFIGMFLCTVFFNVPLNNQLDKVDPMTAAAEPVWGRYLVVWTRFNHIRTVTCTASLGFFIAAIADVM